MTRTTVMALLMSVALPLGALAQSDGSPTDAAATGMSGAGESGASVGETPTSTGTAPATIAPTDEAATGQSGSGESGDSTGSTPTATGTAGAPVDTVDDSASGTTGTGEAGTSVGDATDDAVNDTAPSTAPVTGVIVTTTPGTAPAADAPAADTPAADTPATDTSATPAPAATTPAPAADAPAVTPAPAATPSSDATGTTGSAEMRTATASMATADGTDVGTVSLMTTESGAMHVMLDLGNLSEGVRAVHIHETGTCEGPTFESAGGHLAGGRAHGAHSPEGMHPGDLPNVTVAPDGTVKVEFFKADLTMDEVMDADGSAFVVHTGEDDYTSQPSGDAGDRLACGVFEETQA